MKNFIKFTACMALLGLLLWKCSTPHSAKTTTLPQDVLTSCTVSQDTFKTWFANKQITPNGAVTPANSVAFPHQNNCDFYQWSERMFLWVTSPWNGKTILESPVFYNVSPEDSAGNRILTQNTLNTTLHMSGHIAKLGANRLPVIKDNKGRLFEMEVTEAKPGAKEMVKNGSGSVVEVDHIQASSNNTFLFVDRAGKTIDHPRAIIQHKINQQHIVHRFAVGHRFIFLDGTGNLIGSEEGQATGDVLMSKKGSLVYYLTMVNDVYAYYLTLAKTTHLLSNKFPTTAAERDIIVKYALAHHITLPDANALAMEIKSSWVEASTIADIGNYVTITATIPTYNTTNPKQWVPNGEKTVKMALVGIHVVGSVANHPEMIWSTFEHQNNTPNAAYTYLDQNSKTQTVPQDTGSGWLFSTNAADTAFNVSHMGSVDTLLKSGKSTDTIYAKPNFSITASNTLRTMPWGSATDSLTNPQDGSSAASNSEIISINNSVQHLLAGNDIRKNYLFIGATWTQGGAPPNGISYGSDKTPGVAIGTNVLANSTMETYFQSPSNSCFTCHSGFVTQTLLPDTISHVFAALQPLINNYNLKKKGQKK